MRSLIETPRGRRGRELQSSGELPSVLPLLDAGERAALLRWARGEAVTRSREVLLKEAGSAGLSIEKAERLCQRLLQEGWVSLREELSGGNWLWKSLSWRDLRQLQSLLGIAHAGQRQQEREALLTQSRRWLEMRTQASASVALDPDLLDELTAALDALEADKSLRRNFALHARDLTKALSNSEWRWLDSMFDLERLGIANFAQVGWLAGDLVLSWQARRVELAPLHCLGLPLEDLQRCDCITPPQRWWLIENRASFEHQAHQLAAGVALLWMPGRPSAAWLETVSHLLRLAPAPAWISADADPSGVDIACTAGARWTRAGLAWEPYQMGLAQWENTTQRWPLNAHDRRLLAELLARPGLPESLRALCVAMQAEGRKAEQEAWL
ncbi:DUF2399 domain-containing protein [Herbaspirillum huttiense]|uniref:DUF2399 domain-containing protein n=2 Tax=Herbaspirillum huttiense TaxID=863372 RepID=A0AAJ2LUD3_9BURK|nr:DUF2399 domain-containing protein [Herbaspirillum huttiense]MDR9835473.1 DUF2399 domain-containing protein [Herbaspirillum huttiense]